MSTSRSRTPLGFRSNYKLPYRRMVRFKGKQRLRKPCNLWKKPPRKFVKKVEAVLSRDTPCGDYSERWMKHLECRGLNLQTIHLSRGNNDAPCNFFTYATVMNAASIMYNGKANVFSGPSSGENNMTGNFADSVKIIVERQSVRVDITNNYSGGGTLKVLTCFPKTTQDLDPNAMWQSAKLEYTNLAPVTATNPYSPNFLDDMPTRYHSFNNAFSVKTMQKHLGAGQRWSFTRHGRCGVYDYTGASDASADPTYKFNSPGINQWLMYIWVPDLTQDINGTTSQVSRTSQNVALLANKGDLLFDHHYTACIRAPDETPIALKKQVKCYNLYASTVNATMAVMNKPDAVTNVLA